MLYWEENHSHAMYRGGRKSKAGGQGVFFNVKKGGEEFYFELKKGGKNFFGEKRGDKIFSERKNGGLILFFLVQNPQNLAPKPYKFLDGP